MESGGQAELQQQAAGDGVDGDGCVLVEARLHGGAPWGFTVQGGLEYEEALIISKVEEGGKADCLEQRLQVGDEIIVINDVELSGYRQEAVALVKGSYKTLQLVVRREFDPGYIEESGTYLPVLPPPPSSLSCLSPPPPQQQQQTPPSSHHSRTCSLGAVPLRVKNRRSEPKSRPHSWHSTKLSEGQLEVEPGQMDIMSSTWHHNYHPRASSTDLSGGFDSCAYLRKSPDQYSSRGSMESLEPPLSSQHNSGAQHHPLGHHSHSGSHPTYSSCHQLSSSRSSNSIDHLHSKRDSAYSSFSTSSSIPEYLASTPFSPERSYSLETVPQRGGSGEMHQADVRFIRTVYDPQQRVSQEHELSSTSAALLRNDSRSEEGERLGMNRDLQVAGVCYRANSGSSSNGNRHSAGPIWGPAANCSSYESLKGVPAPPRRSDSYVAIRNHERPNSWSSLEHGRSLRSLQKGSWHHSSGPVASAKGSYGPEGQLHTVIEKSPESSPTTKPRQGGGFPQPPCTTTPSSTSPDSPSPQSGQFILPTGKYPVPQPEPHYAQIPSVSPGPGSSRVYPSFAKESSRQQQRVEGATEGQRDTRLSDTENVYQNNTSSFSNSSSTSASTEFRTQAHETDRPQQEDSDFSRSQKTVRRVSEGKTTEQRPLNRQGPHGQNFQGSHIDSNHESYSKVLQEQDQKCHYPHMQTNPRVMAPPSQEWKNNGIPLQSRGDRSSSMDHSNNHSELAVSSRLNQSPVHPQAPSTSTSQHSSHFIESPALNQQWDHREQDKERDHPLTRLENALAEVQSCASPDSVFSASSHGDSSLGNGPTRSLSVLEKVNRFERRERTGMQRSYSITSSHNKVNHLRMPEKVQGIACGAEDLRNMLERSTKIQRTLSYRGGSGDHLKHSSYRDTLKDAQSKVLRSTSFRRKDLDSSISPLLPAVPSSISSSSSQQSPLVPAKHHPTEKKGPKTMPKPQGIVITPQSPPPVTSPHTPKERHVISPDVRGPSPPTLPSIPPVGPPTLTRICGRKRLGADQKKRSYSEPENLNEVGLTDAETPTLFRRGETSVADRRKMFELAASGVTDRSLQNATSRPDLRQLQHNALAEYVERKKGLKKDEEGLRNGSRPRSAYLYPGTRNNTVSYSHSDTISLSSTSSLLSPQDSEVDRSLSSGERRHSSTLTPGADLRSIQSNLFYPGRVTTPRLPVHSELSAPSGPPRELQTQVPQDVSTQPGPSRQNQHSSKDTNQPSAEPQCNLGLSNQLHGALRRVHSGVKSCSTEDLLRKPEETQTTPHHHRSRSSPTKEMLSQDLSPDKIRMLGVFVSEPGSRSPTGDRPADIQASEGLVHLQHSQKGLNAIQPAGPSQDLGSSHTPVTRRERQRNNERQRSNSTSTLAASVGLPCPFSPTVAQDGDAAEWHASERLSQANLDAITFPGTSDTGTDGTAAAGYSETPLRDIQMRNSLSDEDKLEDTARTQSAFSFDTGERLLAENADGASPIAPSSLPHFRPVSPSSPPPSSHPSMQQHLSSLRISESSLFSPINQRQPLVTGFSQEDADEVFLQNPAPPSPPPPIHDTSMIDDFPLPPPPLNFELEAEEHTMGRTTPLPSPPASPSTVDFPSTASSCLPSLKPPPSIIISTDTSTTTLDNQSLEYQPVPRREKTSEELRVEALARQLVLTDSSLAPLLDTWGNKSTVERMEDIFTNRKPAGKSPWQQRASIRLDDRVEDEFNESTQSSVTMQNKDNDLREDEKDLNTKQVELCEALRCNVAALQQEKEALCEEQKQHQALGASIDKLVQERLKPNERDKYSMFIGDLERIVNLLLSLCSRLSRIDKSLLALEREELMQEDAAAERDALHHKRSLLLRQTDDARELKENLDRRQQTVHAILSSYLTASQLQDYRQFVSTKPSLLIRQRHLDNLIRQVEEQLTRLAESLPQELAEAHGWSRALPFSSSSLAPCFTGFAPLPQHSIIPHATPSMKSTTVTSL
ncbi:protein Shroom3 isoform X2 [Antennarius striatus]|uniref:protein Shroom3 isoform X2 n=1 Tax=Antennarius striatus TaxID=241820 RepID=UPI0035B3EEC6